MTVEISVLGRFSVSRDGVEIPDSAFRGRLVRKLVRVLIARRGSFVAREVLIEALWPAAQPADPDLNLNVLITRARHGLGDPALILTGGGGYSFAGGSAAAVDAERFLAQLQVGRSLLSAGAAGAGLAALQAALSLWAGEPLPEDAYDEWAQPLRTRLVQAHADALQAASEAALALGETVRAAGWARAAVAVEPLREAGHLLLARALAASGDTAGALAALAELRRSLAEELGLDPSPEAEALQRQILRPEDAAAGPGGPARPEADKWSAPARPGSGGAGLAFAGRAGGALAFAGRTSEMGLAMAATCSPVGPPGAALIVGPSGMGKTRLLVEVTARCPVPALAVRASASEQDEPWQLLRSLLRAAVAQRPEAVNALPAQSALALATVLPELVELRPVAEGSLDVESRRALIREGAVRILQSLAGPSRGAQCRLLIAVDDLQWVDASSLSLLAALPERVAGLSLLAAMRSEGEEASGPMAGFLSGLQRTSRPLTVRLGPLGADDLRAAIGSEDLLACLIEETDASPMAVSEVIRELASRGLIGLDAGGHWQASPGYDPATARVAARRGQGNAIRNRIDQHPGPSRELLCLLGLAGRAVPARLLADATASTADEVLGRLGELALSDLVRVGEGGWSPAHDLIGQVAWERLPGPERARLHQAIARALRQDGADPAEIGRHLLAAGDEGAAVEALAEAAHDRLDLFAQAEAEAVAEQALSLRPNPRMRTVLLEVRAEARARMGNLAGARRDLRGALGGLRSAPERSRVLARMALLGSGSEDLHRAAELAELALAEAGREPSARAEALAVAAIIDMNAGRPERAGQRCTEALELFRQGGNARGMAGILDAQAMATFLSGDIRAASGDFDRAARLLMDTGDLLRAGTPRSTRGHALTFLERPAEGLADAEEALDLARTLGHAEGEAYALWHASEALSALGRGDEAQERARSALGIAERIGHREWTAAALRGLGIAAQAAGRLDDAREAFQRSLAAAEGLPVFAAWACARLALVLIQAGDHERAGPLVTRGLAEGPGLSRHEARLARAELAVACREEGAAALVAEARGQAEAAGHLVGARRLGFLEQSLSG